MKGFGAIFSKNDGHGDCVLAFDEASHEKGLHPLNYGFVRF